MKPESTTTGSTAAASVAPPETVTRFAVIVRNSNGKAELLGTIHTTEPEAVKTAEYWQNHYASGAPVTAETVAFNVPTRGAPVKTSKDLLP